MKNGTIILIHNREWGKWYSNLVCNLIEWVTKSPFVHAQVYLDGWKYETSHPEGFRKSQGIISLENGNILLTPKRELTEIELSGMVAYFEDKIDSKIKYNYIKLFVCFVLFWSKPLWNRLGFVPFQDDRLWGEFCSAGVDNAFRFVGIDLLPNEYEEYTSPGDLTKSKYFEEYNNANI